VVGKGSVKVQFPRRLDAVDIQLRHLAAAMSLMVARCEVQKGIYRPPVDGLDG
jgi:hypothetical protein